MNFPRPFVYISALMRTGSTLLGEALTQLPQSFVFLEPYWGLNSFSVHPTLVKRLRGEGVDLQQFLRFRRPMAFLFRRLRTFDVLQDFMIREVKSTLFPQLSALGLQQVGVKEIRHNGWQHYVRHFPGMKMVMLGRDPRDIYLSAYRKIQLGGTSWRGPVTPATVARHLGTQFSQQLKMQEWVDCLTVRYEDLCTDPCQLQRILTFCQSPLEDVGNVGQFMKEHPLRIPEHRRHGNTISNRSVYRWQREDDRALLDDALKLAALMPQYTSFWGYDE